MRLVPILLLLPTLVAACASPAVRPFSPIPEIGPVSVGDRRGPRPAGLHGYDIRLELRPVEAPEQRPSRSRLTVFPEQLSSLTFVNQRAYIAGFEALALNDVSRVAPDVDRDHAWLADPIVDVVQDGMVIELIARDGRDPAHMVLAFRAYFADLEQPFAERELTLLDAPNPVTLQLPTMEVSEVLGVTTLALDVPTLLAHVPLPGARSQQAALALYATVHAVPFSAPAPQVEDLAESSGVVPHDADLNDPVLQETLDRERSADQSGFIRLAVVRVERDLALGSVHAAESLRSSIVAQDLGAVGLRTSLTAGARLRTRRETSFVADVRTTESAVDATWGAVIERHLSGLDVRIGEGLNGQRDLHVSWRAAPVWKDHLVRNELGTFACSAPSADENDLTLTLRSGEQLVPIAKLENGGVAALWMRYEPDTAAE